MGVRATSRPLASEALPEKMGYEGKGVRTLIVQ